MKQRQEGVGDPDDAEDVGVEDLPHHVAGHRIGSDDRVVLAAAFDTRVVDKHVPAGIPGGSRGRVPGLRREELAALAGINADYYLRIEQGRVDSPSAQVLDALARALRLDQASTACLHALADTTSRAASVTPSGLAPRLADLVDQLTPPALIVDRYLDCLVSNALARALSPNFAPGRNLLRQMFLDPAERRLHED